MHTQRASFRRRLRLSRLVPALALLPLWSAARAQDAPSAPSGPTESVVVTTRRLPVQTFIDRKVYTVTDDLQSSFGGLSDVLTAIPSIDVDPEGSLTLRGDSHVLILVDGKPSALFSGSSAGENLQSFPAADIERIEVLTTPPPQYRAAGAAGVINIITRRHPADGTTGSLRASGGNDDRAVAGADVSLHAGRLSASLDAGYRHEVRQKLLTSEVRSPLTPATQTQDSGSSLLEIARRGIPTAGVRGEYAVDDVSTVTGAYSWLQLTGPRAYTQIDTTRDSAGTVTAGSERAALGQDRDTEEDARLGYARKLGRPGEELSVSLHRASAHQAKHWRYVDETLVPDGIPLDLPGQGSYLLTREGDVTDEAGLDYVLPFLQGRVLKLGYLFEQDDYRLRTDEGARDLSTGLESPDPATAHDFGFRQQIHAAYASYQAAIGRWSVLGGLRMEDTRVDTQLVSTGGSSTHHYRGLFPSLHIERSVSDNGTVSLGASRRVGRPDPGDLDPYVYNEYNAIQRTGNPDLLPQYTQAYEAGYGFQGHALGWQLTGYYRRNHDSVTDVTQYLGGGVSLTTRENVPLDDAAGMELTADGRLGPLTYSVSADAFRRRLDTAAQGQPGLQSTEGVNVKLKLDYRPTSRDAAQISFTRTDRQLTAQGYVLAAKVVNLGYRHQLLSRLTVLATVSDVFNGQRRERIADTPGFTADYVRAIRGPVVYAGFLYAFGQTRGKEAGFQYEQP